MIDAGQQQAPNAAFACTMLCCSSLHTAKAKAGALPVAAGDCRRGR